MRKKKILIVEDDTDLVRALTVRLRAEQYDTFFAVDFSMAVSAARKVQPDLILLDLGIPGGDGFVIMEELKKFVSTEFIPIVVITARDPKEYGEPALKAGAAAYFQKPVENQVLLSAIQETIGENYAVNGKNELN